MVEALTGAANCLDSVDEVIEHVHHEYEEDIRHISPSEAVEYASVQNLPLMENNTVLIQLTLPSDVIDKQLS